MWDVSALAGQIAAGLKDRGWWADNPENPHVPGATARLSVPSMPLSSKIKAAITAGFFDQPREVSRRNYQMKGHDSAMLQYVARVWENAVVSEMHEQGIPDIIVQTLGNDINSLINDTQGPSAKVIAVTLDMMREEKANDPDNAVTRILDQTRARYPRMDNGEYTAGVKAAIYKQDMALQLFRASDMENRDEQLLRIAWESDKIEFPFATPAESYDTWKKWEGEMGLAGKLSEMKWLERSMGNIQELGRRVASPEYQKAAGILVAISQELYSRANPDGILYRGVYDLESASHPVVSKMRDAFSRAESSADSVSFQSDSIVAFSTSKRAALTFSAGGGLRGSRISAKGLITQHITAEQVALYWPAIYRNIGSNIDTFETWVYEPNMTMVVAREEFEQR